MQLADFLEQPEIFVGRVFECLGEFEGRQAARGFYGRLDLSAQGFGMARKLMAKLVPLGCHASD